MARLYVKIVPSATDYDTVRSSHDAADAQRVPVRRGLP